MTQRGRPPVGRIVYVRMPEDLIADIDRMRQTKESRAMAIRRLLAVVVASEKKRMGMEEQ